MCWDRCQGTLWYCYSYVRLWWAKAARGWDGWCCVTGWLRGRPPRRSLPLAMHTTVLLPQRQQSSAATREELTGSRGNKLCTKRGGPRPARILPAMDHYSRLTNNHRRAEAPLLPATASWCGGTEPHSGCQHPPPARHRGTGEALRWWTHRMQGPSAN